MASHSAPLQVYSSFAAVAALSVGGVVALIMWGCGLWWLVVACCSVAASWRRMRFSAGEPAGWFGRRRESRFDRLTCERAWAAAAHMGMPGSRVGCHAPGGGAGLPHPLLAAPSCLPLPPPGWWGFVFPAGVFASAANTLWRQVPGLMAFRVIAAVLM